MKTLASALLLFAAINLGTIAYATPPFPAQMDDVREAVFRALFVRAKTVMPGAKVYTLEKEDPAPGVPKLISALDPSAEVLHALSASVPPIILISERDRKDTQAMMNGDGNEAHTLRVQGALLQIVSLRLLDGAHVQAETYIEAGLGRAAISVPYRVTLQKGQWTVREDARLEWRQAADESDIQAAVVREEVAESGTKPGTPAYLSIGVTGEQAADPPATFLTRFAHDPTPLQKGSRCPPNTHTRDSWIAFAVQPVRWVSDDEAQVRGSSYQSADMGGVAYDYRATRTKDGWRVSLVSLIGA